MVPEGMLGKCERAEQPNSTETLKVFASSVARVTVEFEFGVFLSQTQHQQLDYQHFSTKDTYFTFARKMFTSQSFSCKWRPFYKVCRHSQTLLYT
jgi:hypothetical protein